MTYEDICRQIVDELQARGVVIRNLKTGRVVTTWEDVWNFSSTGELFHIWDWYGQLWPETVDERGVVHFREGAGSDEPAAPES